MSEGGAAEGEAVGQQESLSFARGKCHLKARCYDDDADS